MANYKFMFNDKTFELKDDKCSDLFNDETSPVAGISVQGIIELLSGHNEVNFEIEYYGAPCEKCLDGKERKEKIFKFLRYYFYIFTKHGEYVISDISQEYSDTSFNKLSKKKLVDDSYVVSVIVCPNCGDYCIEIEQCEV